MLRKLFMFMVAMALSAGAAYAAPADLPETGQTTCYDALGAVIACAGTGQDGDFKKGVPWPSPRFTVYECGSPVYTDHIVKDNLTGLMWVRMPSSVASIWQDALAYANDLTLCGANDWRLPNVNELESLINLNVANNATWLNEQGFINIEWVGLIWSSTFNYQYIYNRMVVNMHDGDMVSFENYIACCRTWPVRGGR